MIIVIINEVCLGRRWVRQVPDESLGQQLSEIIRIIIRSAHRVSCIPSESPALGQRRKQLIIITRPIPCYKTSLAAANTLSWCYKFSVPLLWTRNKIQPIYTLFRSFFFVRLWKNSQSGITFAYKIISRFRDRLKASFSFRLRLTRKDQLQIIPSCLSNRFHFKSNYGLTEISGKPQKVQLFLLLLFFCSGIKWK